MNKHLLTPRPACRVITVALAACLLAVGGCERGRSTHAAAPKAVYAVAVPPAQPAGGAKKVYGSAFLDPYFEHGQEIRNAVKVRYRCQVVRNECTEYEMWKIVFMFHALHKEGNPKPYLVQGQLMTNRFVYPHPSRRVGTEEVKDFKNIPGQAGLYVSVPDNHRDRKVGAMTRSPAFFPQMDSEIDYIKGFWSRAHMSQADLNGKEVAIEVARGDVRRDLTGWSVHGDLTEGDYRVWRVTIDVDGQSHEIDCALPDGGGEYLSPARPVQIATEAFVINPGFMKAVYWDVEIQREHSAKWEPIKRWKLVETDADPTRNTWGMKLAQFKGRPVIEASNDGTPTYATKGEIIELD